MSVLVLLGDHVTGDASGTGLEVDHDAPPFCAGRYQRPAVCHQVTIQYLGYEYRRRERGARGMKIA